MTPRPSPIQDLLATETGALAVALLVEDSPAMRRSLVSLLEATGMFSAVLTATDGLSALAVLQQRQVDLVLCDMHMERCDGMQFLVLRASHPKFASVPVIMLTGDADIDVMVNAFDLGAHDYVNKGAAPAELCARIGVHLKLKRATDELQAERLKLERLTRQDPLTGLANRRNLDEILAAEMARGARYGRDLSLVMVDLDHFKSLNDRWGHQAGDHVLREVASILSRSVREQDVVARYGGEEMAVVMPETAMELANLVAERLRIALCTAKISWRGEHLPVTASFGVVGTSKLAARDPVELLRLADRALYRAKAQGRNRVTEARPETGPIQPALEAHAL